MIIHPFGPTWFYWIAVIIHLISAVIALYVSYVLYKSYIISKEKIYLYLFTAFLLLCIDLLIFTLVFPGVFIYYKYYAYLDAGVLLPIVHFLNLVYMFCTLMAYTLFIFIYSKAQRRSIMALLTALVLSLVIYSYVYVNHLGFNLVCALLLLFVMYYTFRNYITKKTKNSALVFLAFSLIFIAHLLLALFFLLHKGLIESFKNVLFIIGHVAQLTGYLTLLILFARVKQHGRKKK
jgi:hypothetical protein